MKTKDTHSQFESWRMYVVYALMVILFVFYTFRLFQLQILKGPDYVARADENRSSEISVQTQRGIIYDRNGYVLARNIASYDVTITPADLPDNDGSTQEVYRQLSQLIDVPVSKGAKSDGTLDDEVVRVFKPCDNELGLTEIVYIQSTLYPYTPVKVKCNIDQTTAMVISEKSKDLPGVSIQITPVRDYPTGSLTAEIIGFLGPIPASQTKEYEEKGFVINRDKVGYSGVESSLNELLAGKNGKRVVERDVAGKVLRDLKPPEPAKSGQNIRLTIDTRLQAAAQAAMVKYFKYWNDKSPELGLSNGVVVAMNPKTGEILAMVSLPSYDNNRFARVIPAYYYNQLEADPQHPLLNQAVSAEFAPGSVFKMAAALGILNEGVITPDKYLSDPGQISVVQKFSPNDPGTSRSYVCWDRAGHGQVNYLRAIEMSCDVYFYKVGGGFQDEVKEGLGIWRLKEYALALGFAQKTGIELEGEQKGLIPDPNWKRVSQGENWSTGDTYISTIGQGFVLVTPLQEMQMIATIANDGKMMQPTLVKEVLDSEGNVVTPFTPKLRWDITTDPKITVYDENSYATNEKKTVPLWIIKLAKEGMRLVVSDGTAKDPFDGEKIPSAGKTGTAEYCDNVAQARNRCSPGNWPAHAWYVGYAPYDDPEIVVAAFAYNGTEGSKVSSPIVRQVLDAYFNLKALDSQAGAP
jgi:penicillin-binding protein 2